MFFGLLDLCVKNSHDLFFIYFTTESHKKLEYSNKIPCFLYSLILKASTHNIMLLHHAYAPFLFGQVNCLIINVNNVYLIHPMIILVQIIMSYLMDQTHRCRSSPTSITMGVRAGGSQSSRGQFPLTFCF